MKIRGAIALILGVGMFPAVARAQGNESNRWDSGRRERVLQTIAQNHANNFQFIAARLRTGQNRQLALRQLDTLLSHPTGDMFWTYPATAFYFYCRDLIGDDVRQRFRHVWKTWTPYRGDTENHFLMYYETLYLMSQEWPELPGTEWFNGKSSAENHAEAEEYLLHWMDETLRNGQTEWDSPRYFYFYMVPLLTLYDYAADSAMSHNAGTMLELLLADYASEYLDRSYCGAHSRDGDNSVVDPRNAEATSYSDFYWEDSVRSILPDLAFAAISSFRCPEIIRTMATNREKPYVQHERKRSRAKMRYSDERYTPVYKTTLMTSTYSLGSIQGGLQQPIQQHTWDVTFADDRSHNTLFALHPYADARELGTFFPENPEMMAKGILQSKASYGNEDKWIGGSPYEVITQDSNELWGDYTLPDGVRFPHVDFFIPKELDMLVRDMNHWTVAIRNGVVVAIDVERADSIQWIVADNAHRLRIYGDTIRYHVVVGGNGLLYSGGLTVAREKSGARRQEARDRVSSGDQWTFRGPFMEGAYGEPTINLHSPSSGAIQVLELERGSYAKKKRSSH